MSAVAKAAVAVFGAVLVLVQQLMSAHGSLSLADWMLIATTALSAIGVYLVPNTTQLRWAKSAVAALGAGFVVAQSLATDGAISGAEWLTIGLAVLGALGVATVPNSPPPPGG